MSVYEQYHQRTGSSRLKRYHMFNNSQENIDVPDGDIERGRMLYNAQCAGCHNYIGLGPDLVSIYGSRAGNQKQFTKYSHNLRGMSSNWSRQLLFRMLKNPELVFGLDSNMSFNGFQDPYDRACIVDYLLFMRLTDPRAKKPAFYVYK